MSLNFFRELNAKKVRDYMFDHVVELILIVLILVMGNVSSTFNTMANWLNIFRNMSMKGLIAFGMTMVIISGQIDLSVGSTVAISGVIVARVCRDLPDMMGISVDLACVIGIVLSFLLAIIMGVMHGYAQHKFGMPAFIVTLASQNLLYGLAGMLSGGFPIANTFPQWFTVLGTGKIGGVSGFPVPALILFIFFVIMFFIIRYTTTGRSMYAIGGNQESARLSGINVLSTKIFAFASVQVMCVLAGFINSAQVLSGSYSFGRGWEVDVISAVVIGGTSMAGGIGKMWGTMVGIIFLGVIINSMTILNVSTYAQYVVRAIFMSIAVLVATYQAKKKA
ncbi:MAG: ABC transporter permease [Clostridiales bacterium]|jgi:ribose/xylose/arabinose/galactoside ABC-type transport system permease subunit|nr:ABC transporter permease [Clostridiales bacterium]